MDHGLDYSGKIRRNTLGLGSWISRPAKWLRHSNPGPSRLSQFKSLSQKLRQEYAGIRGVIRFGLRAQARKAPLHLRPVLECLNTTVTETALDANCGFGYTEGLKFKSQDAQTMSDSNRKTSGVRVRFAPSPTGYLHVGGARTALFNWLFARRQGGTMILRVEDTDAERNKPELVQGILDGLQWLGVNWDEGPFYQSQRTELYLAAAKKCLANGAAFLCYCPAEKYAGGDHAEPAQDEEPKGGGPRRVTRCTCRDGKPSTPGVKPAVRFKVPVGGTTKFVDAVFGEREFSNEEIEDFVLLRSGKGDEEFGQSMYQLGVVVDDIDMRITHVIRGADHISNTPKQVLLYRALRAEPPVFAHVPLILGADKSRLSKRHGATACPTIATRAALISSPALTPAASATAREAWSQAS